MPIVQVPINRLAGEQAASLQGSQMFYDPASAEKTDFMGVIVKPGKDVDTVTHIVTPEKHGKGDRQVAIRVGSNEVYTLELPFIAPGLKQPVTVQDFAGRLPSGHGEVPPPADPMPTDTLDRMNKLGEDVMAAGDPAARDLFKPGVFPLQLKASLEKYARRDRADSPGGLDFK